MKTLLSIFISILFFSSASAQYAVQISNQYLRAEISTIGAELRSIKAKNGTEYVWQGNPEHWEGQAPLMFPVCVKFKDQKYTYKGKEYYMPDMGLAKLTTFKAVDILGEKVVFEMRSNESTLNHYPFEFVLRVIYELKGKKLIHRFELHNEGDERMFFALGGHPGFRFPFNPKREMNQLVFDKTYFLRRTVIKGGLVQKEEMDWLENERTLTLGDERIPDAGMFVKDMPSRKIGVGVVGAKKAFIEVDLEDFPNCNIWTPPGKPYVCIEPMLGHHDLQDSPVDIAKKPYLKNLDSGKSQSWQFSIKIL